MAELTLNLQDETQMAEHTGKPSFDPDKVWAGLTHEQKMKVINIMLGIIQQHAQPGRDTTNS